MVEARPNGIRQSQVRTGNELDQKGHVRPLLREVIERESNDLLERRLCLYREQHGEEFEVECLKSEVSLQNAKSYVVVNRCREHPLGVQDRRVVRGLARRFALKESHDVLLRNRQRVRDDCTMLEHSTE